MIQHGARPILAFLLGASAAIFGAGEALATTFPAEAVIPFDSLPVGRTELTKNGWMSGWTSVGGRLSASTDITYDPYARDDSVVDGPVDSESWAGKAYSESGTGPDYAQARAWGSVTFGTIHAEVDSRTSSGSIESSGTAGSSTWLTWNDIFRVTSTLLPIGSPTQLTVTMQLDSVAFADFGSADISASAWAVDWRTGQTQSMGLWNGPTGAWADGYLRSPAADDRQRKTMLLDVAVGDLIAVDSVLSVNVNANGWVPSGSYGYDVPGTGIARSSLYTYLGTEAGVTLLSDSGTDYAEYAPTPTPEPGTMALLGTGLLGLFGAARRRAKR